MWSETEKGDRDLEWEVKNKGDIFLLKEKHENFVAAVTKWDKILNNNYKLYGNHNCRL